MIEMIHLDKYYNDFQALDDFNLYVGEEELLGFVGINGAGKTTTMKIMSGLIRPTSGAVLFEGKDIYSDLRKYQRQIGYMPDFFGVYDNLKVSEYMAFFASIYRISASRLASICERLLRLVHLEDYKNQYVDTLSRGEKQKLCLARCLIHDPKLLILDEPASGLDPKARVEIRQILQTLNKQGKTIIISSHILSELSEMCTHLGIIRNGHMVIKDSVGHILGMDNGARRLIITVARAPKLAVDLVRANANVENLSYTGNELRISFLGTDEEASQLLGHLLAEGMIVTEFRFEKGTLESLFLELADGERQ